MRPFSPYANSFDGSTLGWWRFGERGGCLDGLVGPAMVNHGADPLDDGYRFAGEAQYLETAFAGEPARTALTLEYWVRAWASAAETLGMISQYCIAGVTPHLRLAAVRSATPAASGIVADIGLSGAFRAIWLGAAAHAVLIGVTPWHAAAVRTVGSPLRLFVNGVLVAASTSNIAVNAPAGDYTLRLGQNVDGSSPAACVVDEVRLSAAARYAADFPITRFGEGRRAVARGPGLEVLAGVAR